MGEAVRPQDLLEAFDTFAERLLFGRNAHQGWPTPPNGSRV